MAAGESEYAVPPVKIAISIVDYKNLYGKLNKKKTISRGMCMYISEFVVCDRLTNNAPDQSAKISNRNSEVRC